MNSIVIIASALFFNSANPAVTEPALSQVESLAECAQVLNDARTGVEAGGTTWYPTKSKCTALEVTPEGELANGQDPEALLQSLFQ